MRREELDADRIYAGAPVAEGCNNVTRTDVMYSGR